MAKILEGIRVINTTQWIPSGAGSQLGDLGADVIKVERPVFGDALRGMQRVADSSSVTPKSGRNIGFEGANRNQRSITINLENERGKDILYRLVEKSHVFITSFTESVLRRLRIDYDTLSEKNPQLIYAVQTAYGPEGLWAEKRGFDQAGQARSGLMWAMGAREHHEPQLVYGGICDQLGATMLTYGILAALIARERFGIGQRVDTSLAGNLIHLQALGINIASMSGRPFSRDHARHSRTRAANPLANFYRCADDNWILMIELQSDRFWSDTCRVLGLERLENDPQFATAVARREHRLELIKILDETFAKKTRAEWIEIFEERGAKFGYSPVLDVSELLSDPQTLVNKYVVPFDHPTEGQVKIAGFPVRYGKTEASIAREAPELGQHTEEVLSTILGYTWEEIAEMRKADVL